MLPPTSFAVLLLLLPQVLADSVCWDRLAPPEVLALVDWALGLPPGLPLAAPLKDAALRCISRQVRWRGPGPRGAPPPARMTEREGVQSAQPVAAAILPLVVHAACCVTSAIPASTSEIYGAVLMHGAC
jgi:hypothetical protein